MTSLSIPLPTGDTKAIQTHPALFKRDAKGATRYWVVTSYRSSYFTSHGILSSDNMASNTPIEVKCKPKNVGRANETTAEQQAIIEAKALWAKKKRDGYVEAIEDLDKPKPPKPMLAKSADDKGAQAKISEALEKHGWVYVQPKLDGIRCLASKDGLFSRTGRPITTCQHIEKALKPYFQKHPDEVLDGELYNHALKDDFNKIISLVRKENPTSEQQAEVESTVQYWIYDCISEQPYGKRHTQSRLHGSPILHQNATSAINHLRSDIAEDQEDIDLFIQQHSELGYEGSMIRIPQIGYEQKRSWSLIKAKTFQDYEFKIVRIEEGKGQWAGCAKRVVCRNKAGKEFGAGIRGSQAEMTALLKDAERHQGGEVTVRFQELTPDGIPRFPVATAFYPDGRDI